MNFGPQKNPKQNSKTIYDILGKWDRFANAPLSRESTGYHDAYVNQCCAGNTATDLFWSK